MKRERCAVQWAAIAAVAGALAGCGGGGSDSSPNPPAAPTLALTAANRDTVSHAVVGGFVSLSSTTSIPLVSGASVADRKSAQVAGNPRSGRTLAYVLGTLRAAITGSGRGHVLAVLPPLTEACALSGTTTTTVDDHDGNGNLSAGDSGTVVFSNCMDSSDETINGTTALTFTRVDSTSLSARLTLTALSDVTANHSLTIDGTMLLDVSAPGATVTIFRTTVDGSVQARIATHLPFADTVTLQNGFVVEETVDTSVAPPAGATGTMPGRTVTTVNGQMRSAAAGGSFDVATLPGAPVSAYNAESYPRSGAVQVTGNTGTLTLTALSASSVRLDLDANGDGLAEVSEAKTWDWLL